MRIRPLLFAALALAASGCGDGDDTDIVITDSTTTVVEGVAPDVETTTAGLEDDVAETGDPLARLQGQWQSVDDAAVLVTFAGGQYTESNNGEVLTTEPVRVVERCPGGLAETDETYFLVGSDMCYTVVEVTPSALSISLVGGRGNTLTFRRAAGTATAGTEEPQGEGQDPNALFGVAVCEALRPAVATGQTAGLERYASPEVLATLSESARLGHPQALADVRAWSDAGGETCNLSAGGDAWFELTLLGDGHVGHNAVSVERRVGGG